MGYLNWFKTTDLHVNAGGLKLQYHTEITALQESLFGFPRSPKGLINSPKSWNPPIEGQKKKRGMCSLFGEITLFFLSATLLIGTI